METVGTGFTMTAMVRATDPPPESFTHAFTEYVSAAAYEWLGVATVLVVPSPKVHAYTYPPAPPAAVASKLTACPTSVAVGVAEAVAASTDETTTSTVFVAVLPKESVAVTTTLSRPVPDSLVAVVDMVPVPDPPKG